jgi:hypothetical protein
VTRIVFITKNLNGEAFGGKKTNNNQDKKTLF